MFSKLQLYILAICTLGAVGVWGIWEYRQMHLLNQAVLLPNSYASGFDNTQNQSSKDDTPNYIPTVSPPKAPPHPETDEEKADDKAIDAIMDRFANVYNSGDYSIIIDNMYTPIVERFGGREKAIEDSKSAIALLREQQMNFVSWATVKPYTYISGVSNKYAIIPYEMEMTYNGNTIKQTGYQLGIKTPNLNWQFVNGDRLTPEIFEEFFPDFPSNVELPEMQQGYE
jgi:hypothetical protein